MKRITLALKTRYSINGEIVPAGVPVAILETDVPWDGLMSAMFAGQLVEVSQKDVNLDEQPVEPSAVEQVQPSSDQQSGQAVDDGSANDAGSQETTAQETTVEGSQLANAGLAASLCKSLAGIGVVTVEQLQAKLEADPSLEGNDSISPSIAKRIIAWWASYQASK